AGAGAGGVAGVAGGDPAGRLAGARSSISERDAAVPGAAGGDVHRHHSFARVGRHGLGACRGGGGGGGGAIGGGRAAVRGRVIAGLAVSWELAFTLVALPHQNSPPSQSGGSVTTRVQSAGHERLIGSLAFLNTVGNLWN